GSNPAPAIERPRKRGFPVLSVDSGNLCLEAVDVDPIEQVKKLREEYERALDAAESRRAAYHEAVLGLHRGGVPLREIAKELGLSHQSVHQIVSGEPPRRGKLPRASGAAAVILVLVAATFGVLRLVYAPPFVQQVAAPRVLNLPESVAV